MLFGVNDEYLKQLENIFGCQIIYRDGIFKTTLENYELLKKTITSLLEEIKVKKHLDSSILVKVSNAVKEKDDLSWQKKIIAYTFNGKPIYPKTKAQANLLNCINLHVTSIHHPKNAYVKKSKKYISIVCNIISLFSSFCLRLYYII